MKKVWKWIMHLNAKAFCLIAALLFLATAGWCVWLYLTPLEPIRDGTGKLPPAPEPWVIGILDFVTNQVADADLSIPIDPFLPALDALTPEARAELIRQMEEARKNGGLASLGGGKGAGPGPNWPAKGGPGALGGGKGAGGGGAGGPNAPVMITPQITFLGFLRRTDGTSVAMFSDSSDKSTVFYSPGKKVHGIEILGADMKEAHIRMPDGSESKIPFGGFVTLAEEEDKNPKPAVAEKPAPEAPKQPGNPKQPRGKG